MLADRRRSVFPRLLNPRNFKTRGEIAVIDPSGRAIADIRAAFSPERVAERREEQARLVLNQAPAAVQQVAQRPRQRKSRRRRRPHAPDLRLVERPATADRATEESVAARTERDAPSRARRHPRQRRAIPSDGNPTAATTCTCRRTSTIAR